MFVCFCFFFFLGPVVWWLGGVVVGWSSSPVVRRSGCAAAGARIWCKVSKFRMVDIVAEGGESMILPHLPVADLPEESLQRRTVADVAYVT